MNRLKTLKEKRGFTLVECIVAMAVLAIMTLLLTMILTLTVDTRSKNAEDEREIDKQIEQLYINEGGEQTERISGGINLKSGAWGDSIPEDCIEKKYYGSDNGELQIAAVKSDFSDFDFNRSNSHGYADYTDIGENVNDYKTFGAVKINGDITITELGEQDITDVDLHKITWNINFNVTDFSADKALKIRLPDGAKNIYFSDNKTLIFHSSSAVISKDTIRIEPTGSGDVKAIVYFELSEKDFEMYNSAYAYFGQDGGGNQAIVGMYAK